jgi:hypothetical protein
MKKFPVILRHRLGTTQFARLLQTKPPKHTCTGLRGPILMFFLVKTV